MSRSLTRFAVSRVEEGRLVRLFNLNHDEGTSKAGQPSSETFNHTCASMARLERIC